MAHVGRVGSVMLTLSITIERYITVCHPRCSFTSASLLLPLPIIFAIVYNIPKFFELKTEMVHEPPSLGTDTNGANFTDTIDLHNKTYEPDYELGYSYVLVLGTEMRQNPWYILLYVFWSKFVFIELIPYILMVVMNIQIWKGTQDFARIRRTVLQIDEGKQTFPNGSQSYFDEGNIEPT